MGNAYFKQNMTAEPGEVHILFFVLGPDPTGWKTEKNPAYICVYMYISAVSLEKTYF